MLHFFTRLASLVPAAKPGKLRLFADNSELWKTVNSSGEVRTLGNAVRSWEFVGTDGLQDTYLVTTDDFNFEIVVTNGRGISSINSPANPGVAGATDTYTIVYNQGPESTFVVKNGRNGTDGIGMPTTEAASPVGDSASAGTQGATYANPDHVHAHGNQNNPAHHAVATGSANGFMSSSDKSKLDGMAAQATRVLVDAVPTDGSNNAVASNGVFDALALKLNSAERGAANGVTPLGADSKVPAIYLPSFVDDVLEFASLAAFPATGESGKIYVTLDNNKTYRWSGSAYVEISASPGSTDAVPEGAVNLYFTAQRVRDTVLTGLSLVAGTAITAADTLLAAFGKLQKQISDNLAALNSHTGNSNNPHSTTAAQVGADPAGTAANAISTHVSASDPHTQYARKMPAVAIVAPTAVISTTATIVASLLIPGNTMAAQSTIELNAILATVINTTAASNLVVDILLNGVVISTTTAALGTTAVATPGRGARWDGRICVRTAGAAGTCIANGTTDVNNLANFCSNVAAPVAINTTVDNTVAIRVATSAATSTCTVQMADIERII